MVIHIVYFRLYLLLFSLCFHFVVCPNPQNADQHEGQLRGNLTRLSDTTKNTPVGANSRDIVKANTQRSVTSVPTRQNGNNQITPAKNNRNARKDNDDVTLDFTANEPNNNIESSDGIPGTIKYTGKNARITSLAGHGFHISLDSNKVVDNVFCASPFDGNITVNYEDSTYDQYILTREGFQRNDGTNDSSQNTPNSTNGKSITHGDQKSITDGSQDTLPDVAEASEAREKNKLILSIGSSDTSGIQKKSVGNIDCYRAENPSGNIIYKVEVSGKQRDLGDNYADCVVCTLRENNKVAILIAQKQLSYDWRQYTLVYSDGSIKRDVTLKVKFSSVNFEELFIQSEPEVRNNDTKCNILHNGSQAEFTSNSDKEFVLETQDKSGTKAIDIKFQEPFRFPQEMDLQSIRSRTAENNVTHVYSFKNGPILLNEKYSSNMGSSFKNLFYGYGDFNIKTSCEYFNLDSGKKPDVLFLDTITINASTIGLDVYHYNAFQVIGIKKRDVPTLLVLPNVEIFLDATKTHDLVVCNSGNNVHLSLTTSVDGQIKHYLIANETTRTKYFGIKNVVDMD